MGLLDNVTSAISRGKDSAERTGRATRLKMQLNELTKERRELAAQLGASLYEIAKNTPELREGRESLFDAIANVDEQRADIQAQLDQIEAEAVAAREAAAAAAEASQSLVCPSCGTRITASHLFCAGCGMPVEEIKKTLGVNAPASAENGPICVACGAQLQTGDVFCISCGAKQPEVGADAEQTVPIA